MRRKSWYNLDCRYKFESQEMPSVKNKLDRLFFTPGFVSKPHKSFDRRAESERFGMEAILLLKKQRLIHGSWNIVAL